MEITIPRNAKTERIRLLVLTPIISAFVLLLVIIYHIANAFFTEQQKQIDLALTSRVEQSYQQQIKQDTRQITGLIQLLETDPDIQGAWIIKDRKALLETSKHYYQRLKQAFNITHIYFHTLTGDNFLRVHRPGRFGDKINRHTLKQARHSGEVSAGVELGDFGDLVLRVVYPWRINGELVGYLELGKEIGHITENLKQITGVDLVLLLNKRVIRRDNWLQSYAARFDWQQYKDWVVAASTNDSLPTQLSLLPETGDHAPNLQHFHESGRSYLVSHVHLTDSSGAEVGYLAIINNTTEVFDEFKTLLIKVFIFGLIISIALLCAYYFYLGNIEKRLTHATRSLYKKIGEHQQAEKELRINRDELAASNRELESYSYSIAHDLRAPLRSITSFSQILLEDANQRLNDDDKETLLRIVNASKRMAGLIDEILQLARITREELKLEDINLSELAERIKQELSNTAPDRQVEWDIQPNMVIKADQRLMERALENLLNNAWKYTVNTPHARIQFGCLEKNGDTVYFVNDNGAGFDMQYAHKLFATFQRLHAPSEYPGSGVGLAIVLRVINRHHGRIWGEGEIGKGATFYFTLPTAQQ